MLKLPRKLKLALVGAAIAAAAITAGMNLSRGLAIHRAPSSADPCFGLFEAAIAEARLAGLVDVSRLSEASRLRQLIESEKLSEWELEPRATKDQDGKEVPESPIRNIHDQMVNALQTIQPGKWKTVRTPLGSKYDIEVKVRISSDGFFRRTLSSLFRAVGHEVSPNEQRLDIHVVRFEPTSWTKASYNPERNNGLSADGIATKTARGFMGTFDWILKRWYGPNEGKLSEEVTQDITRSVGAILDVAAHVSAENPNVTQLRISTRSLIHFSAQRFLKEFEMKRDLPFVARHPLVGASLVVLDVGAWVVPIFGHVPPILVGAVLGGNTVGGISNIAHWSLTLDLKPEARIPTREEIEREVATEMQELRQEQKEAEQAPAEAPATP